MTVWQGKVFQVLSLQTFINTKSIYTLDTFSIYTLNTFIYTLNTFSIFIL